MNKIKNKKWVYLFDESVEAEKNCDGSWDKVRNLLGGKGAGLADMTRTGIPVPPGFTVTTEACNEFRKTSKFPDGQWDQMLKAIKVMEKKTGKKFGDSSNPLLVSCRSSAKFSMPGMMNTILNIGLTDDVAEGMIDLTRNPRFVWDSYRRLIEMFGTTVFGLDDELFEYPMAEYKAKKGYKLDSEMKADDWKSLVDTFKEICKKNIEGFPDDVFRQLELATKAVFVSWMSKRAIDYRKATNISDDLGTAVNIVTMVFGNMDDNSGTGVAFTRNPTTGENKMIGEYLLNAQGEDVIAGIRNTKTIEEMAKDLPEVYSELLSAKTKLENHYHDMQDIEFTLERGKVWILQSRNGKRTAYGALKIALDLLSENIISQDDAISAINPDQLRILYSPRLPSGLKQTPIVKGVNASSGVGVGKVVFDSDTAEALGNAGNKVILLRPFVKPDDIHGMLISQGVVTSEGGATSHAAVVCRQHGIPCIVGAYLLKIDLDNNEAFVTNNGQRIREGDLVTVSGTSGEIFLGEIPLIQTKTQDDPYLTRYANIVWNIDSGHYIDHGLAHLWVMRDIVKDSKLPAYLDWNFKSGGTISDIPTNNSDEQYISFYQPSEKVINDILQELHWEINDETRLIIFGFIYNLFHMLENSVGIGNHYKFYRPLNDPQKSLISKLVLPGIPVNHIVHHAGSQLIQLIGFDVFGINHRLKNYLDWASLQFWLAIEIYEPSGQAIWALDKVNPLGEGIIFGDNKLSGFLVIYNDELLTIRDTKKLYNALRLREFDWKWYRENDTSWQEIINTVKSIQDGEHVEENVFSKCYDIGLLQDSTQISLLGKSLVTEQIASDRKKITYRGKELPNE